VLWNGSYQETKVGTSLKAAVQEKKKNQEVKL
jgi:hypothetical protein